MAVDVSLYCRVQSGAFLRTYMSPLNYSNRDEAPTNLCLNVDTDRTMSISRVYISVELGVEAICGVESPAKEDRVAILSVGSRRDYWGHCQ